jgi:type II secretory pathway pseudopilin PulG
MTFRGVRRHRVAATGFTLVEAVVSILLVSLLLAGAMKSTSAAMLTRYQSALRVSAIDLACALLAEVVELQYAEPIASPAFGIESGEVAATKSTFDDVDDFHLWTESPPTDRGGAALAGAAGFTRSVAVAWVQPANPDTESVAETGLKRITVTVTHAGGWSVKAVGYRALTDG